MCRGAGGECRGEGKRGDQESRGGGGDVVARLYTSKVPVTGARLGVGAIAGSSDSFSASLMLHAWGFVGKDVSPVCVALQTLYRSLRGFQGG